MLTKLFSFVEGWPLWLQLATYVVGLALGIFCLVKFCNIFVDSSCAIAKKMKISPLIIGLTIVAMGTSLPELAVSVSGSITALMDGGNAEIAIGNVVGSNICNLLLVLGFSVVFTPIVVKKNTLKHEFPILIGVSAIVMLFVFLFGTQSVTGEIAITRWEGGILVAGIVAYIVYLVLSAKRHPDQIEVETEEIRDMPLWKSILLTVLGAVGIFAGGQLVEFGASNLALEGATAMGLDEDLAANLVGLTIVAVGTSLPELVTSTIAAKKGENEIALGNVIGSNIFNALFVLGIAGVICPLKAGNQVYADVVVMMVVTLLVFVFALRGKLKRGHGIALLTIYGVYLAYLIMRTMKPEWFSWMM